MMLTNLWCGAVELIRFKKLGHRVIMGLMWGHLGTRRSFVAGRITNQSPAAIGARTRLASWSLSAWIRKLGCLYYWSLNRFEYLFNFEKNYPNSILGSYVPDISMACQAVPNMLEDTVYLT